MTAEKSPAASNRADETRDLLIRTAIRLFAAKGVNGVSLRAVGEAAGQKNTSAVHYHFGDRDRLLMEAVDRILVALAEPVEGVTAAQIGIDAEFRKRSGAHAVLAAIFLPLMTLPLRHPDWGWDAIKLLSRVMTGEAGQIAREFNEKIDLQDDQIIDALSASLDIRDRPWLKTRIDFAFVSIVAVLASGEFMKALKSTEQVQTLYLAHVAELLDFVAVGFAGRFPSVLGKFDRDHSSAAGTAVINHDDGPLADKQN